MPKETAEQVTAAEEAVLERAELSVRMTALENSIEVALDSVQECKQIGLAGPAVEHADVLLLLVGRYRDVLTRWLAFEARNKANIPPV